ncbi:unnamed protein product [Miscanthus lutarioriparius]|uniref:riboflavin kinase n=1 Tax=Miscanthus lutarioriparius TaxID=422564 RepID=A0A811SES0_9POAL|nr:unnamed protein product [Miscanthus lutarioriparius]
MVSSPLADAVFATGRLALWPLQTPRPPRPGRVHGSVQICAAARAATSSLIPKLPFVEKGSGRKGAGWHTAGVAAAAVACEPLSTEGLRSRRTAAASEQRGTQRRSREQAKGPDARRSGSTASRSQRQRSSAARWQLAGSHRRWCNIKALPGATRLIKHLRSNGVPTALASNSPRSNIEAKISCHQGWKECFSTIVGGDEVEKGKPSPDIFLEAAKRMNATPNCLVIEDSLPGVTAGKAAGMHVIAVPSIPKKTAEFSSADVVINSLLDVRPEKWGIEDTLPIEPWFISGPVIKGFGRGSIVLGIPTANLPAENFSDVVSEYTSGVYFGWAGLSTRGIYKMVMSVGWNPYFGNTEKTVEPWLLHNFGEDFYGEELRLATVGYIRPEANFPSLESLIERIQEDGRIAEKALDLPMYAKYKDSPYLRNTLQLGSTTDDSQAELNSK